MISWDYLQFSQMLNRLSLDKLTLNKTTVVIAHRLSTILNSDKIYVMDKGVVMDSGNHEELLTKSDTYKNYYNKQINKS